MITLTVNGQTHQVDADPDTPLLYVLRNDLGAQRRQVRLRAGPMRRLHRAGRRQARLLLPVAGRRAGRAQGAHARRASARREARPAAGAFEAEQAAQCGYCIAGMIMRAQALLERNNRPDRSRDARPLAPNLCRCGTHMRILRAVRRAAEVMGGGVRDVAEHEAVSGLSTAAARLLGQGRAGRRLRLVAPAPPRQDARRARALPGDLAKSPLLDSWIRIDADGRITVFTGKAELGQGLKTALIQVAADELAVAPSAIELVTADTARTPDEGVTAGSHSMQDSGTAILQRRRQRARPAGRSGGVALRDRGRPDRDARRRGACAGRPEPSATASWSSALSLHVDGQARTCRAARAARA